MSVITSARTALLALVAGATLAAGCASQPNVRHDADPGVDLHTYKTFGFYDMASATPYAPLVGQHLVQATRAQLERQHYTYSESNPDLRVAMFLVVGERTELRTAPGRGPHGYHSLNGGLETVQLREGSLRIDIVDTRRNALVWQGIAEGRVDDKHLADPGAAVQQTVAAIFANYGQPRR